VKTTAHRSRRAAELRRRIAAGGLCSLGLLSGAIAAPPSGSGKSPHSTLEAARPLSVAGPAFGHPEHTGTRMDLQAPKDSPLPIIHGGAASITSTPFPSAIHHLELKPADPDPDDRIQRSALNLGESSFQTMSRAEMLARRAPREGLPVARLWESKSTLLSIGLNNKRKPGLWLTFPTP